MWPAVTFRFVGVCSTHACVWDARVYGTYVRSSVCARYEPCTSKNEMQSEKWYISCLLPSCRRMWLLCGSYVFECNQYTCIGMSPFVFL